MAYEDLPWQDFLRWLDPKGRRRSAVVSLVVPAAASVEVGVVGAGAVVSGIGGRTDVRGVTRDITLVGLTGAVRGESVSGSLEAQHVTGDLRYHSVAGDLTVVDGAGASVRAESVSGDMVLDLDPSGKPTDIRLTTVSGEIAIRLPHPADARVEANTASGSVSNAFEDLRVGGQWGAKKITGTLGAGTGTLKATTVSGSIALLRRPPAEDDAYGAEPTGKVLYMPPVFAHGRLRLYLLKLLDQAPRPWLRGDPAAGGALPGPCHAPGPTVTVTPGWPSRRPRARHPRHRGRPQGLLDHRRRARRAGGPQR
ncbi:hypothetical protein SMICM304S_01054 [Streptomyces microflavus]